MRVYIQEWQNRTASILTDNGQVVWTFSSAAEAEQACRDWHSIIRTGGDGERCRPGDKDACYCLA